MEAASHDVESSDQTENPGAPPRVKAAGEAKPNLEEPVPLAPAPWPPVTPTSKRTREIRDWGINE